MISITKDGCGEEFICGSAQAKGSPHGNQSTRTANEALSKGPHYGEGPEKRQGVGLLQVFSSTSNFSIKPLVLV